MFTTERFFVPLRLCGIFLLLSFSAFAQIPAPKDVLGFTPGDDRKLASWAQTVDYFQKLDKASDRVNFEEIGKSTMGAPFVYATISSPRNIRSLEYYRGINDKLADPRKLKLMRSGMDNTARGLIATGKTIVLITFGIHSTEVGSYLTSMLVAHELASSSDPRIRKILDETIILIVPSLNPDGVDIVKNWYDKTLGTPYEGTNPPELYHKYTGHDLNRDWYAFTQVETQLTVDKIHNVWRPQIVLDVHQQGISGARQFLPPYMPPVEPNVPKQIVEGFTELGTYIANDMRKKGFQGITTGTTYDAWTPARAYSHYHGGVRILSETASARLATPVEVKFEQLGTSPGGLDAKKESPNFGPVWKGGEWKLRNITDYMTATAFSLLDHAADNREKWLSRFYEIGKEAVRPRKDGELNGFKLKINSRNGEILNSILRRGGVEVADIGVVEKKISKSLTWSYPTESFIPLNQPYGSFAKALLEKQEYPDLKDENGNPISPYDVTSHSLNLLMGVEVKPVYKLIQFKPFVAKERGRPGKNLPDRVFGIYKSHIPNMDAGWTDWALEQDLFNSDTHINSKLFDDSDIRSNKLTGTIKHFSPDYLEKEVSARTIIFPDQPANQILNGYAKGSMPDEYVGGVGKEGVENLKKFVEAGGTLVFLNRSSLFAIEQFNLPIKNVTAGLDRKDFYIPGSILRTEIDTNHPIAKGMPRESIAWFENSPAFEISDTLLCTQDKSTASSPPYKGGVAVPSSFDGADGVVLSSRTAQVDVDVQAENHPVAEAATPLLRKEGSLCARIIARYPSDPKNILLSGWALGTEKIAGKAALVEVTMGKGKIILFGFRPQYRGQSLATFPLLFNAISQ